LDIGLNGGWAVDAVTEDTVSIASVLLNSKQAQVNLDFVWIIYNLGEITCLTVGIVPG